MEPPPPPPLMGSADPSCTFAKCFCRWRRLSSSRIPHVAPGRDCERVPPVAGDRAAWSLLIGFVDYSQAKSPLHLRRFRVARSGRVLGRSDDTIEALDDVDYRSKGTAVRICAAEATPSPDGRSLSLCLFFSERGVSRMPVEPPRPVELFLDLNTAAKRITAHPLPDLQQDPLMPCLPISAAGHLWAPYFTERRPCRLVMRRLDKASKQWVQVGASIDPPHEPSDCALHGYAVVGNAILLSLEPHHLFLAFDCSTHHWSVIVPNGTKNEEYIPIRHRGLYVREDDTIYFLSGSSVFAYKLMLRHDQDQNQNQYVMEPPTFVDCVGPFGNDGCGYLMHLGGRIMCYVWISVPVHISELDCNCDTLHVLITTFQVKGNNGGNGEPFIPKAVQVLHSTTRRLDISPGICNPADCFFCFIQEYEDFNHEIAMPPAKKKRENAMAPSMLLEQMEVSASSSVVEFSKTLACCRNFLNETPFREAVMLEGSAIKIKKSLYIMCQVPSCSTVYEINILDGRLICHNNTLAPRYVFKTSLHDDDRDLMERPLPWHLICDSESIFAVPDKSSEIYMYGLDMGTLNILDTRRLIGDDFSITLVLYVGHKIIAISDTLGVIYFLSNQTHEWERRSTSGCADLEAKVNLSGYVVLSNESFMVSDDEKGCCYFFDLESDTWKIVELYTECTTSFPLSTRWFAKEFLCGRSVFAEGFIYTCADGGLRAYEIIDLEGSYYLSYAIYLKIPWRKFWEGNKMCLDYVGEDKKLGAIMFCVVQGNKYCERPGAPHKDPVWITTIQVKTEGMPNGKLKPVAIGLVDVATSFIEQEGGEIWTSSCFALDR